MSGTDAGDRRWLLRLVISFAFAQGAVCMARPAVSYHALELGAGASAVGVITAAFALLPLAVAVPLGRRTDRGRCGPLLPVGLALIAAGCALSGTAPSLVVLGAWSALLGLGHLVFVIGAQSLVARQSGPHEHDRNFSHFTIGGSMGQLVGPVLSGWLVGGAGPRGVSEHGSAVALFASGALSFCAYATLWRIEAPRTAQSAQSARADRAVDGSSTASPSMTAEGSAVPVVRILRARGVPAGIFTSLAVLSTTDVLTAYLPVVGEERGIAPGMVGVLLSLRAAASVLSRIALPPMTAWLGRQMLLVVSCVVAGLVCALLAVPLPVWALALALVVLGFGLGVGQPLTMSTVVQAAPERARSTALALRLTGNRLGQVGAPAGAGLLAGAAGAAAPFVLLGALLLGASVAAAGSRARARTEEPAGTGSGSSTGSSTGGQPEAEPEAPPRGRPVRGPKSGRPDESATHVSHGT